MKLFVPELGSKLQLTEDWSFKLYAENRNETLAYMNGYKKFYNHLTNYSDVWLPIEMKTPDWLEFTKDIDTTAGKPWTKARDLWEEHCNEWKNNNGVVFKDHLDVVLPKGSILTVDRIYVRKGAKDFSSLSFYLKGKGVTVPNKYVSKTTKRGIRFWAKLDDCNNINFNLV